MRNYDLYITAADLMNYHYCPRIIYYTYVLKQPQTKSKKQWKGLEKEYGFKSTTQRTKIVKKGPPLSKIYNVQLSFGEFVTKVDCIGIDLAANTAFPIQLKYSFKPNIIYKSQRLQLLFEAYLIEQVLHYKVPYGYIKYVKSNYLQKVYLESKDLLFETIAKIREIIGRECFPEMTEYKKRCVDCCYRRMCYG